MQHLSHSEQASKLVFLYVTEFHFAQKLKIELLVPRYIAHYLRISLIATTLEAKS